jgi:hypothetical protein
MQTSAKRLLETIIREELSLLREDWGDKGIGPKEKKQFVEQLKLMFSCLYDDLAYELNKGPINAQGLIDKIFDKIIDTDKYQDPNYNIRCYGKGNVYQLVKQELDKQDSVSKTAAGNIFNAKIDPNKMISPTNLKTQAKNILDWYKPTLTWTILSPISKFPDRKTGRWAYFSWTGPGGVTADKINKQLEKLFDYYNIYDVKKYYTIRDGQVVPFGAPGSIHLIPKFKKDINSAIGNFLYLAANTDLIELIKKKTSLRQRLRVMGWITDNILTDSRHWHALVPLFSNHDQTDVLQVFSARSNSVKDVSDMGGPVDAKDQDIYFKVFRKIYADYSKEYERSWAAMQRDPYGEAGRRHLYKYNMFRDYEGNEYFYNTIASMLAWGIPFVGPYISSTIFAVQADQDFMNGDTVSGTIHGVFALLPFVGAVVRAVPGVKELGAKGMFELSKKLSGTTNPYLNALETKILEGLYKYKEVIGPALDKYIQNNAMKYLDVLIKYNFRLGKTSPVLLTLAEQLASGTYTAMQIIKPIAPYLMTAETIPVLSNTKIWQQWQQKYTDEQVDEILNNELEKSKVDPAKKKIIINNFNEQKDSLQNAQDEQQNNMWTDMDALTDIF